MIPYLLFGNSTDSQKAKNRNYKTYFSDFELKEPPKNLWYSNCNGMFSKSLFCVVYKHFFLIFKLQMTCNIILVSGTHPMIRHLFNLWRDHIDQSSSHLIPYGVIAILLTYAVFTSQDYSITATFYIISCIPVLCQLNIMQIHPSNVHFLSFSSCSL